MKSKVIIVQNEHCLVNNLVLYQYNIVFVSAAIMEKNVKNVLVIKPLFFLFRVLNMEELPWTEEEDESADHPYYNNIPGKMPPPGGFIDTRLTNQNATSEGSQVELRLLEFILDM